MPVFDRIIEFWQLYINSIPIDNKMNSITEDNKITWFWIVKRKESSSINNEILKVIHWLLFPLYFSSPDKRDMDEVNFTTLFNSDRQFSFLPFRIPLKSIRKLTHLLWWIYAFSKMSVEQMRHNFINLYSLIYTRCSK